MYRSRSGVGDMCESESESTLRNSATPPVYVTPVARNLVLRYSRKRVCGCKRVAITRLRSEGRAGTREIPAKRRGELAGEPNSGQFLAAARDPKGGTLHFGSLMPQNATNFGSLMPQNANKTFFLAEEVSRTSVVVKIAWPNYKGRGAKNIPASQTWLVRAHVVLS